MKNRIEELRNEKGIRQEELAYNPSILLAYKVAVFFGLTIEDVFIFEED